MTEGSACITRHQVVALAPVRHRMAFASSNEGSNSVLMTWRAWWTLIAASQDAVKHKKRGFQ